MHKFYFKRFHIFNYKKSIYYKTPTEVREDLEVAANKKELARENLASNKRTIDEELFL